MSGRGTQCSKSSIATSHGLWTRHILRILAFKIIKIVVCKDIIEVLGIEHYGTAKISSKPLVSEQELFQYSFALGSGRLGATELFLRMANPNRHFVKGQQAAQKL